MTTKEQELKALAQIRKIVEGLGQDSYIGTAFDGCFEIAEENIENDFACSMKQRAEIAEKKLIDTELENSNLRANIGELKQNCANLESKVLNIADAGAIKTILNDERHRAKDLAEDAAQRIVELADKPGSAEFRQAVQDNRASRKRVEDCENLMRRLMEIMG